MLREIDQREANGLRVIGYYDTVLDPSENVTVAVLDENAPGQLITWSHIPAADFKQAFEHPFGLPDTHKYVATATPEAKAA